MKKNSILLILGALLVISCELIVDVDVPETLPTLAINSFFAPDSSWQAIVHVNRNILDHEPFKEVPDARVVIYHEGTPLEILTYNHDDSSFQSSSGNVPAVGQHYEIRVEAPGYPSVRAASYVPEPVNITGVEVTIPDAGSEDILYTLRFQERPHEVNYYEIRVEEEWLDYVQTPTGEITRRSVHIAYLFSDDPVFNDNEAASDGKSLLFKDVLLDGKEASIRFRSDNITMADKIIYRIYLSTVSKDFYLHQSTAKLQDFYKGDPFAQPVNVYTNVESGFGVFSGYSQDVVVYER